MNQPIHERFDNRNIYTAYGVTIAMREWICGGLPRNPDVIAAWVKSRTGHDDDITATQTAEAIEALQERYTEACWNTFPGDDRGLYIWSRQIKAMLRESATMLGIIKKKRGSKQVIQHGFEIKGRDHAQRIYLGVTQPTGYVDKTIHVMTPQGPRDALVRVDYVERAKITFDVWIFKTHASETRHIGEAELVDMLRFAQENGLGADRSQGHGKFDVVEFTTHPTQM